MPLGARRAIERRLNRDVIISFGKLSLADSDYVYRAKLGLVLNYNDRFVVTAPLAREADQVDGGGSCDKHTRHKLYVSRVELGPISYQNFSSGSDQICS